MYQVPRKILSCWRGRKLYTSGPSLDTMLTNLQTSFNAKQLSFRGLQLLLNESKTKCMLFNRSLPIQLKSRIGFLYRNKASLTHAAKHTLVKLTILPILDFGDVIYKVASNTLLNKLDAVYHSAIRFFTKAPYTTHHCDLYALVPQTWWYFPLEILLILIHWYTLSTQNIKNTFLRLHPQILWAMGSTKY
jgi:hypothetical protein